MNSEDIKISKFLSLLLRHKPETADLKLDPAGWVAVDELLDALVKDGKSISKERLLYIVENNDKKRFAFSADGKLIRASQGHSIDVDLGYEPAVPPETLYHGTAERFIPSIMNEGLKKRERHHVHMTESIDVATAVGARYGKTVLLLIASKKMYDNGHAFFRSSNNVWLTDHVPANYLSRDDAGF